MSVVFAFFVGAWWLVVGGSLVVGGWLVVGRFTMVVGGCFVAGWLFLGWWVVSWLVGCLFAFVAFV